MMLSPPTHPPAAAVSPPRAADPSASAALKLTGNLWIAGQIELASQCLTLAAKSGVQGEAMEQAEGRALDKTLDLGLPMLPPPLSEKRPVPHPSADATTLQMLKTMLNSPIPFGYAQRMAAGDYDTQVGQSVWMEVEGAPSPPDGGLLPHSPLHSTHPLSFLSPLLAAAATAHRRGLPSTWRSRMSGTRALLPATPSAPCPLPTWRSATCWRPRPSMAGGSTGAPSTWRSGTQQGCPPTYSRSSRGSSSSGGGLFGYWFER